MADDIEVRSIPLQLEGNMRITHEDGKCSIVVGGAMQPEWTATGDDLIQAIASLVEMVAKDAVEDEARMWSDHITGCLV